MERQLGGDAGGGDRQLRVSLQRPRWTAGLKRLLILAGPAALIGGITQINLFVGQAIAWSQLSKSGVFIATNPSSSFFYVLTAAHAFHLIGGFGALFDFLPEAPYQRHPPGLEGVGLFLFLRAFASGCTALTGVAGETVR